MKFWITPVVILLLNTFPIYGQSYNSKILFTAQKGSETHCGEMTVISITPSVSEFYEISHFMVRIDGDFITAEQLFSPTEIEYNEIKFSADYNDYDTWCTDYDIDVECYEIQYDSTLTIPTENKVITINHFNAIGLFNNEDTVKIQAVEDFGVIPFYDLDLNGYKNFQLSGIELSGKYYPIIENECLPIASQEILHPAIDRTISTQVVNELNIPIHVYNKYGKLITFQHSDGCQLKVYGRIKDEVQLIMSETSVYDLKLNTDYFFKDNTITGCYKNENGEHLSFTILEDKGQYVTMITESASEISSISPLNKYTNLVFHQDKVNISDILGNTYRILNNTDQYLYGGLLEDDLYAFYSNTKKTIHLFDRNLELFQDLELLFPNIDGFKMVNNNFVTWRENKLSYFNFQTSSSIDLDENADINSISIFENEITWKSTDENYFKKITFDSLNNYIIEDQPIVDDFINSNYCFWNDSILVYADTHTLETEHTDLIELSLYQSKPTDQLPLYDIGLDSLKITSFGDISNNEYIFYYEVTNLGLSSVKDLIISTSNESDNDCQSPLLNYHININNLEPGGSYSDTFIASSDQSESICFYISSPSGFSDSNFNNNYKCYEGEITTIANTTLDNLLVYPNPTNDQLHIENYQGPVYIFNAAGQLKLKSYINETLNVSSLIDGFYILNIDNSTNIRFIKN